MSDRSVSIAPSLESCSRATFSSITVDSFVTALLVAIVLGFVNAIIRPILVILTLPVTILTLGLFIFVINGLLFWLVGSFIQGFVVQGFWAGFFGAIVYSLISWLLSALILKPASPRS